MNIRFEQPNDIDQIKNIHRIAFESKIEANLVDALRNAGVDLISLVAEMNREIIGHILFSPVKLDKDTKIMGLAPMAVLPNWQRKGVGSKLINEGMKVCKQAGYEAVVVLGHPDYYYRFGFEPSVNFKIISEYDVPPEVFMIKELKKGALKDKTGTVKYHQIFDEP